MYDVLDDNWPETDWIIYSLQYLSKYIVELMDIIRDKKYDYTFGADDDYKNRDWYAE